MDTLRVRRKKTCKHQQGVSRVFLFTTLLRPNSICVLDKGYTSKVIKSRIRLITAALDGVPLSIMARGIISTWYDEDSMGERNKEIGYMFYNTIPIILNKLIFLPRRTIMTFIHIITSILFSIAFQTRTTCFNPIPYIGVISTILLTTTGIIFARIIYIAALFTAASTVRCCR